VLQAKVNKYIGYLHSALLEFHNGWSMIDFTMKAKTEFQIKQGKLFKHEIVYDILKRTLPYFEILIETIHPKMARSLALLDTDDERALERDAICVAAKFPVANTALLNSVDSNNSNVLLDEDIEEAEPLLADADAPRAANSGFRFPVLDLAITATPRPSIGKKKAKFIEQQAVSAKKKMKVPLPSPALITSKFRIRFFLKVWHPRRKPKRTKLESVWLWLSKPKTELLKSNDDSSLLGQSAICCFTRFFAAKLREYGAATASTQEESSVAVVPTNEEVV
jgi:hypothetical protein